MTFDTQIDRRNTHSSKWDMMEPLYGVSPDDGLAMWVADMDFRPPQAVADSLTKLTDHGIYGYFGDDSEYLDAVAWWMKNRHGWEVPRGGIFTTHGLVNGTALCVDTFTQSGDGVVLFTPVYHAFAKVIRANDREVIELPLVQNNGRYEMDFDSYDASLPSHAKMVILCSPHNPGGRVWSSDELQQLADFCETHDLTLISDEVHNDLVYKGNQHHVLANIVPSIRHRLVTLVATTKTFNLAGCMIGSMVVADDALRSRLARVAHGAAGMSFNRIGMLMCTAAWEHGDEWLDTLLDYLAENRRIFDEAMASIPGVRSMPIEATYLCWVDFADTGMDRVEFTRRVEKQAQIAVNHGNSFGIGGDSFLRFNIACRRDLLIEAAKRLKNAFSDLQ